jgi:Fic family protein
MIVSRIKPPYEITSSILKLITSISEKVGEVNANLLNKPSPKLRKQNRIKTIHSSLKIEGNTLTEEQITAHNKQELPHTYASQILLPMHQT